MKIKTIIFITVILTLLVAFLGLKVYNYKVEMEQDVYESGYQVGYVEGITYTQQTGNIVAVSPEGNVTEITIIDACNNILQQQQRGLS